MSRSRRRDALLDFAVARGAIIVGLVECVVTHPAARRVVLAVAAVIAASSLVSTATVEPCRIPGHARTTVVECEHR